MPATKKKTPRLANPAHPGEILREVTLPALGRTKVEIAKLAGISRNALNDILAEKARITPHIALRFGKLTGSGPEVWMNMQQAYDLWKAEAELDLSEIPTIRADAA